MSDSPISAECLVHYNNQHIQVRKDFFDLCAYDKDAFNQGTTKGGKKTKDEPNRECMAKILRVLETLTNHEKMKWYLKASRLKARGSVPPKEPKEFPIELAYSIISDLLYGTYGESTIRKSIAVLIQMGYIKRYQKTKNSVPCYLLNIPILQAALEQQAKEPSDDEVLNLTPEENEVSILQAEMSKVTPEPVKVTAGLSKVTPNNISNKKDFKKEDKKEIPTVVQQPTPSSQSDVSSLPLSQKKEEETKPLEVGYDLFDHLCQRKGYAADFRVPRNEKNNAAIQELRQQGANAEQVEYVFNDIWEDKDTFWRQHRGKPSTVASQFTARVWKMTAPAAKRQTRTGTPNYTEDRIGLPAQNAKPAEVVPVASKPQYRPKLDQTPVYSRLKFDEPARPRSREARLQKEL